MNIYVDADVCPVKEEIVRVANRHAVAVTLVSNTWMRGADHPLIRRITVAGGLDAADDWITEQVANGDIIITADISLAARCVEKGGIVLRPNGKPLDHDAIGMVVAMRDLPAHLRESGDSTGGPAPFTRRHGARFLDALEAAVQTVKRGK